MGKLLQDIRIKPGQEDLDIIRNEFFLANLQRLKIYSWIATPLSLVHIILFSANLDPAAPVEFVWRKQIILLHVVLMLLALFAGFYAHFKLKMRKRATRFDLLIGPVFFLILLSTGAFLANADQLVTTAITPYLVVCIIAALFLQIQPVIVAGISLLSFGLFALLMHQSQPNSEILLSNLVNGLTASFLAIGLSAILWVAGITRYRQNRVILRQKIALEESYQKLKENAKELESLNATKDRFFSIIAHDLFGPIAGISSYLDILDEEYHAGHSDHSGLQANLGRFRNSVNNTLRLIENLLTWARSQRHEIEFHPEVTDLCSLIRLTMQSIQSQADSKNIHIKFKDTNEPVLVNGDPNMLETVFRNLLSNAIKFTYPGGEITITVERMAKKAGIKFIDHGVGISAENIKKLFLVDQKITSRGTASEPGTGLGLILCKEFIDHHQGIIEVTSEQGKGSTFSILIPLPE
jgi:two-component system, sensor histidine kinase and response regulator